VSGRPKALISLILCMLFWGVSFVSTKIALAVFPPMTIGAFRFLLASAFLACLKLKAPGGERLAAGDIPALAGAGLFGVTLYFWFENTGLELLPASEASIITGAIPVMSMLAEEGAAAVAARRGGKPAGGAGRPRPARPRGFRRWAGAFVSMAGVWLVAKASLERNGSLSGYLFMAGACFSWVAYNFFIKALAAKRSRLYIVFWQSFFGFLGFLPFAAAELPGLGRPGPAVWGHLLFLGVFCSAAGYWLYAGAVETLGIGVSSVFINFIPVITVITGMALLHEALSPLQWLGAALVLSGVFLTYPETPVPA